MQYLRNRLICGCLEGIDVYVMGGSNILGKDSTGDYNKMI